VCARLRNDSVVWNGMLPRPNDAIEYNSRLTGESGRQFRTVRPNLTCDDLSFIALTVRDRSSVVSA
jgi:hypothetical protein